MNMPKFAVVSDARPDVVRFGSDLMALIGETMGYKNFGRCRRTGECVQGVPTWEPVTCPHHSSLIDSQFIATTKEGAEAQFEEYVRVLLPSHFPLCIFTPEQMPGMWFEMWGWNGQTKRNYEEELCRRKLSKS